MYMRGGNLEQRVGSGDRDKGEFRDIWEDLGMLNVWAIQTGAVIST